MTDQAWFGRAENELKNILAQNQFSGAHDPWYQGLLDRAIEIFFTVVTFILSLTPVQWALFLAALAAFILGSGYAFRSARQRSVSDAAAERPSMDLRRESSAALNERATEAARESNYREAIRLRYLSFLAELREKGLVDSRPVFTNWEYVLQIRAAGNGALAQRVEQATRIFESAWYGKHLCEEKDYRHFNDLMRGVVA